MQIQVRNDQIDDWCVLRMLHSFPTCHFRPCSTSSSMAFSKPRFCTECPIKCCFLQPLPSNASEGRGMGMVTRNSNPKLGKIMKKVTCTAAPLIQFNVIPSCQMNSTTECWKQFNKLVWMVSSLWLRSSSNAPHHSKRALHRCCPWQIGRWLQKTRWETWMSLFTKWIHVDRVFCCHCCKCWQEAL